MSEENKLPQKVGRPSALSDEVVNKLEQAFATGANDTEACSYAGISRQTYYQHLKKDAEFSDRIERQKSMLPLKARQELKKLIDKGDPKALFWYLDRVEKRHKVESSIVMNNQLEQLANYEYDRLIKLRSYREDELDRLYEYARSCAEMQILRKRVALEGEILISEQTGSSYTNPIYTQLQGIQSRSDKLRDKLFPPNFEEVKKATDIRDEFFR